MRKTLGRLLLLLSLILGVSLTCYARRGAAYTQCLISEDECARLIAAREEDPALLEGLRFNDEALFYDKNGGALYYSVIEDGIRAYDPLVELSSPRRDAQIAFTGGGLSPERLEANQTASVLIYTPESYFLCGLVCTTLPLMDITCSGDIGDDDIDMELTLFDNQRGAVNRVTRSSGVIRVRGASSREYPKQGYRLQLTAESPGGHERDSQRSLLGLRQDDDWILYAGYNDEEKVRNVFSSNLWKASCASDNAARADAGVEYKYLELFINGEYWGLYALGYPVDKKQLGFGLDSSSEALYKIAETTIDERDVARAEDGSVPGFEQKGVEGTPPEGWDLLLEYYADLYAGYCGGADPDNLIDFCLFINLIQGVDHAGGYYVPKGRLYNFYLAVYRGRDGQAKALYVPWDLDRTWGHWHNRVPYEISPETQISIEDDLLALSQLLQDPGVREAFFAKYRALRAGPWSEEALNALIDQCEAAVFSSGAYLRDMARWPDGVYGDPADRLDLFRDFVSRRLAAMDAYYQDLEARYAG